MSRANSALKGIISSQVFMVINLLLNLFSTPFIIHHLNAQVYGLSIIIFQIVGYLGIFDFGLTSGMVRYLATARGESEEAISNSRKIISTSFIIYAFLGVIVSVIGIGLAPFASMAFKITNNFEHQVTHIISIISVIVGLQFLVKAVTGVFFAHQRQVLSNSIIFATGILNTILIVLFIYLGYNLWSFVYAQIIVLIISGIINVYFFKKYYRSISISIKDFDYSLLKEMFSFGFFIFLNGIAVQIIFQTDRIMIGSIISLSAVTIYSITSKIPEIVSQLIWKITDNALPAMIELSGAGSKKPFRDIHNNIMQLSLSLATAGFWIIIIIAFPFIKLWVGGQYYAGITFIAVVSYMFLIHHSIIHVTAVCLNGAGFTKGFSIMSLIEAAANLALSIILGRLYGITGIVVATIIAGILTSGWFVPYIAFKNMDFDWKQYFYYILKPVIGCSFFGVLFYYEFNDFFKAINQWIILFLSAAGITILFLLPVFYINKRSVLNFMNRNK
ncbi:oligosaccharide flippase family protein [uncultured Mucilaginibacter sp.]|uniref:lipopolysaccharide biosynthesis protein n=1 Tax=uncultured Mucilaginibacter sp. TaxID=797541 RepID=UPI00262550C1|nr:oligosaccharide flippase family protein [uncultured Mucilaginibacter sp.]